MDHRRRDETQAVHAQRQDIPLLDGQGAAFEGQALEELRQHLDGLGAGDQGQARESLQRPGDECRVVGLDVVDHQVVGLPAVERFGETDLPHVTLPGVDGVQDGGFPVQDEVGIVGDAFRYDVLALEKVEVEVVDADVLDIFVEGFDHFRIRYFIVQI